MRLCHASYALFLFLAASAFGDEPLPTNVPSANHKIPGVAAPNILSPELIETPVAQGSNALENPSALVTFYGYDNNGTMVPTTAGSRVEATKTEPDKNTYLVLKGQKGADPCTITGPTSCSKVTNWGSPPPNVHWLHYPDQPGRRWRPPRHLDGAIRTRTATVCPISTEAPGTRSPRGLLFTSEGSLGGGVWQATLDVPSKVEALTGIIGQGRL